MPSASQIAYFKPRAVWAMAMLLRDFPEWKVLDAAADLGNAGHESGGLASLQELKPTVPGSAGGLGWYQWTGPRRRAYEAYCKRNGFDPRADLSNYKFHFLELKGEERATIKAVSLAKTLGDKVVAFERHYERAGIKHYPSRLAWAEIALAAYNEAKANSNYPWPVWPIEIEPETETEGTKMDNVKNFLLSKTLWGILIMLAPLLGKHVGLDLNAENVEGVRTGIGDVVTAIGGLLATWGRLTAKATLTVAPAPKDQSGR